jgi:hypothetical protein
VKLTNYLQLVTEAKNNGAILHFHKHTVLHWLSEKTIYILFINYQGNMNMTGNECGTDSGMNWQ